MNAKRIDVLNIGLMVISLILAFVLPFWLFIFSYAVLGPLHYLTEIGWLRKQKFFTTGKYDFLPLLIIAIVWTGFYLLISRMLDADFPVRLKEAWFGADWRQDLMNLKDRMDDSLVAGLIGSIAMVFFRQWWAKILALIVGFALGMVFSTNDIPNYAFIIGALLPTLIHVYIFTGIFMLYGAVKSKSAPGFISVGMLLLFGAACFVIPGSAEVYGTGHALDAYKESGFISLNKDIYNLFATSPISQDDPGLLRGLGIQIQRFIAFAYTYHYLNWFSKTSIIGWHKVSPINLVSAIVIWAGSVALYVYDYRLGLKALLFLSILHVVLEFPLNVHSFVGIFKVKSRGKRKKLTKGDAAVLDT